MNQEEQRFILTCFALCGLLSHPDSNSIAVTAEIAVTTADTTLARLEATKTPAQ